MELTFEELEEMFGRVIKGMAYANGSVDDKVVEALKTLGLKIPEDITVVEFANSGGTAFNDPAIFSSDLKLAERGKKAVDYLTGKPVNEKIGFELIKTNSVKLHKI